MNQNNIIFIQQVLQSHTLEAVKGAPGEPQVFIEPDPEGNGQYRSFEYFQIKSLKLLKIYF